METRTSSKKLGLLVYEAENAPRYYEIKKSLLKFIIYGLPIVTLILLGIVLAGSLYFEQISERAKRKEPIIIKNLRENVLALESSLEESQKLTQDLEERLAKGDTSTDAIKNTLGLFLTVPGMQDLTRTPNLAVENIDPIISGNRIQLKFNIINQTKNNKKLAGYIFVLMKNGNAISIFPENSIQKNVFKIKFNSGESFATQRFRPVDNVYFSYSPGKNSDFLFKVLIFSRTGDLLYKQLINKKLNP
jgi:hypothetical protein